MPSSVFKTFVSLSLYKNWFLFSATCNGPGISLDALPVSVMAITSVKT